MARSLAAAFAAVEGPGLDAAITPPQRLLAPTPEPLRRAFEGFDYSAIRRVARWLVSRYRCSEADAEEATHEALVDLMIRYPQVFGRDRDSWMRYLFGVARNRLFRIRASHGFFASLEHLLEAAGDAPLNEARSPFPEASDAIEDAREVPPPGPGERWSQSQMLGSLQRFADREHRPPRARDCRALEGLPSLATLRGSFGSFPSALRAAGLIPRRRRKRWTPAEAADACLAFRRRNGRWPDETDLLRNRGYLPSRAVMIRFFGGTNPAEVQQGVESVLDL